MELMLSGVKLKKSNKININFKNNKINGLIGSNNSCIFDIINLICNNENLKEGYIKYGNEKIDIKSTEKDKEKIRKNVFCIKENTRDILFNINVLEDINYYIKNIDEERLNELLKNFNLNNEILSKNYSELSNSEYKRIVLIVGIMVESSILILENPTNNLDNKNIQNLIKILKKLKRQKNIIITSNDTNFLLEITDNIILINDNGNTKEGDKYEILSDENLLEEINYEVPNIIKFINEVKKEKNIWLGYRDNINDLIKDVYRYAK